MFLEKKKDGDELASAMEVVKKGGGHCKICHICDVTRSEKFRQNLGGKKHCRQLLG